MRTFFGLILLLTWQAHPLPAQTSPPIYPVAYPQDTTKGTCGTPVPLGFTTNPIYDEARFQELIPATHLPTKGGVILGIAINCQTYTGVVHYKSMSLEMGHTKRTTLDPNFAVNLTQHAQPVKFLAATYAKRAWTTIFFSRPFTYNGKDNLVLQFRKVYDRKAYPLPGIVAMETSGDPGRNDLPKTAYTFGPLGSGASNAPTAKFLQPAPLKIRLLFGATPTLTLRSDPGGAKKYVFPLGGSINFSVYGPKSSFFVTFMDTGFRKPFAFPGIGGFPRVRLKFILAYGTVPGPAAWKVPIPNNPSLVGARLVYQAVLVDPQSRIDFTNATDNIFNQ